MIPCMRSAAIAAAVLAATAGQAQASLIISFSITNESISPASVAGTVTGEILGLSDNTTSPGTVEILTYPAGMDNAAGSTPIVASSWTNQIHNEFSVSNSGQIIGADFSANNGSAPSYFWLDLNASNASGESYASLDGYNTLFVYGGEGLDSVSFTSNQAAPPKKEHVPEPATLTLLASGFLAFGGFGLRRRRQRAAGSSAVS